VDGKAEAVVDIPFALSRVGQTPVWLLEIKAPVLGQQLGCPQAAAASAGSPTRSADARIDVDSEPKTAEIFIAYSDVPLTLVGQTQAVISVPYKPKGEQVLVYLKKGQLLPCSRRLKLPDDANSRIFCKLEKNASQDSAVIPGTGAATRATPQ
jgi:hypothetical protein